MAKFGFDTSDVDPSAPAEYDPIPNGEYILTALMLRRKEPAGVMALTSR